MFRAGILRGYLERRGRRQHLIELTEIVKAHFRRRQSAQRTRGCGIIAKVAEESVTEATTRNASQLLLDGSERLTGISLLVQLQENRKNRREPACRPRNVDVVEDIFASVSLEVDQQRGTLDPPHKAQDQRRQERVVDFGAISRGHFLQQGARLFDTQTDRDGRGRSVDIASVLKVQRQWPVLVPRQTEPILHLFTQFFGLCQFDQSLAPIFE